MPASRSFQSARHIPAASLARNPSRDAPRRSAAELPEVSGRILAVHNSKAGELASGERNTGCGEACLDLRTITADVDRRMGLCGGNVICVETEVHLRAVVGLVPPGPESQCDRRGLDVPVSENSDEEVALCVSEFGKVRPDWRGEISAWWRSFPIGGGEGG